MTVHTCLTGPQNSGSEHHCYVQICGHSLSTLTHVSS